MTALPQSCASIAGNASVLDAIRDPGISIAIWERAPLPAVPGLLSPALEAVRFSIDMDDLGASLVRALDAAHYPAGTARATLEADITDLAAHFVRVMRADAVDIRLERVTGDACRKFHADYVTARLITTYVGRGTQWLDSDAARTCDCGEMHDIRELGPGDVAIFKGRHWDEDGAAIHRSPPIAGSGDQRLLLVINPVLRGD